MGPYDSQVSRHRPGSFTSENKDYRNLPAFFVITQAHNGAIAIFICWGSLIECGGNQMGRKPKTTGPTARNNPEAFKQVLTRMGVAGWRGLRMLAVERDTTVNALAIEAFNDLLKKYGKRQSVETPLLDD